ncbi:hypothetical protein PG984_014980 [Apiospora sp. TS-2023a]
MASQPVYQSQVRKFIIATGCSSGLGFEVVKQLITRGQYGTAYTVIIGARDVGCTLAAYGTVTYENRKHRLHVLSVDLNNLGSVQEFAKKAMEAIPEGSSLDWLFLNAGMQAKAGSSSCNSKWCDTQVVNSLSQHYLMHELRPHLVAAKTRIVVVSSGGIKQGDPEQADRVLLANSGADEHTVYCQSKFTQLLNAHWWRRELAGSCIVVAVSPGLIPNTGIFRNIEESKRPTMQSTDAKTVEEGAQNLLRAFTCTDMPEDPDRIFLTSWGTWWERSDIQNTLDKELQNKWSPSKEEIKAE